MLGSFGSPVAAAASDWDALEQSEVQIQRQQSRLVREQTSTFIRDLNALQLEVTNLRAQCELDRSIKDDVHALRGQVGLLEVQLVPYVDELKLALQRDIVERSASQSQLQGRCGDMEESLKRLAQVQQDAQQDADRRLTQHEMQLSSLPSSGLQGQLQQLRGELTDELRSLLQRDATDRSSEQSHLQGRFSDIEEEVGKLAQLQQEAGRRLSQQAEVSLQKDDLRPIRSRVEAVEGQLALMADFKAGSPQIEACVKDLEESVRGLVQMQQISDRRFVQHADLLSALQVSSGQAGALRESELAGIGDRLERLEVERKTWDAKMLALEDRLKTATRQQLDESQSSFQKGLRSEVTSVSERVASLEEGTEALKERFLFAARQQLDEALAHTHRASREEHTHLVKRLGALEGSQDTVKEHALLVAKQHIDDTHGPFQRSVRDEHAAVSGRLDALEVAASTSSVMGDLKSVTGRIDQLHAKTRDHASQLAQLGQVGALEERVAELEALVGETSSQHGQASERLQELHGRLSKCEKHGSDLQRAHAQHATIAERLDSLEGLLGQDVGKLAFEGEHAAGTRHFTMVERVAYLEQLVNDSAEKHGKQLQALKDAHEKQGTVQAKHARELEAVKSGHAQHAGIVDRLDDLERMVEELSSAHDDHGRGTDSKVEQWAARLATCEAQGSALQDLRKTVSSFAIERPIQAERVEALERQLGESSERSAAEMKAAQAKHDALHNRLQACEKLSNNFGELKRSHSALASDKAALDEHQTTLAERVAFLESELGESASKNAKEVEAMKASHIKHLKELDAMKTAHNRHATLAQRVDYIEEVINDSADKHAAAIAAQQDKLEGAHTRLKTAEAQGAIVGELKRGHLSLVSDNAALKSSHATLLEHLGELENALAKASDNHTKGVNGCLSKLDQIQEMKAAHVRLAGEKSTLSSDHAALADRVARMEHAHTEGGDKWVLEAESLKGHVSKQITKALDAHKETTTKQATFANRLDILEHAIGLSTDRHSGDIQRAHDKLEELHARHSTLDASHAALKERATSVEGKLKDMAQTHARELQAAHAAVDGLHGRLQECETHGVMMQELAKSQLTFADHKTKLESHQSSFKERLDTLEQTSRDASAELVLLRGEVVERYSGLEDRFGNVEHAVSESFDAHARELHEVKEAAGDRFEQLHRDRQDQAAQEAALQQREAALQQRVELLEVHVGTSSSADSSISLPHSMNPFGLPGHSSQELDPLSPLRGGGSRSKVRSSLMERLGHVEQFLGSSTERTTQDREVVNSALNEIHAKMHAWEADHEAAMKTHLQNLRALEDSMHHQISSEVAGMQQGVADKFEALRGRLGATFDRQDSSLAALEASHNDTLGRFGDHTAHHGTLANRVNFLESIHADHAAHHETLADRVNFLESILGESDEKHGSTVQGLKAAHAQLENAAKVRDMHHATVVERLDRLEMVSGETSDSQAQRLKELASAVARVEPLTARVEACEAQEKALSELRLAYSNFLQEKGNFALQHDRLSERLDELEGSTTTLIHRHAAQAGSLENARTELGILQRRVSECEVHGETLADFMQAPQSPPGNRALRDRADRVETSTSQFTDLHQQQDSRLGALQAEVHLEVQHLHAQLTAVRAKAEAPAGVADLESRHSALQQRVADIEAAADRAAAATVASAGSGAAAAAAGLPRLEAQVEVLRSAQGQIQREVEALKSAQAQMQREAKLHEQQLSEFMLKENEDSSGHRAVVEERLAQFSVSMRQLQESDNSSGHQAVLEDRLAQFSISLRQLQLAKVEDGPQFADIAELKGQISIMNELVEGERAAREAQERSIQLTLSEQRRAWEHHGQLVEDRLALEREKGLELREGLTRREQRFVAGSPARGSSGLSAEQEERLKLLHRSVGKTEDLIRREAEDRLRENRRIWEAIDMHTHDLSTQASEFDPPHRVHASPTRTAKTPPLRRLSNGPSPARSAAAARTPPSLNEGGGENVGEDGEEEEYLPFPCQPLSSFLRLSGQANLMLSEGGRRAR